MKTVSLGLIGLGGMARFHAGYLMRGEVPAVKLVAGCDNDPKGREWMTQTYGEKIRVFATADEMLAAKIVDAVLIVTPHYTHPELAIKAFQAGCHVVCEKPAGAHTKQVREMNAAAAKSGLVFSLMFQFRMRPVFQKIRDLVVSGELGKIHRTRYVITDWMRTQAYYNSGGWRGTWGGEGGGVLLNQAPHNLDIWLWVTNLRPKRLRAFCEFGKHHQIEVEDEVTAHVEFENGATGLFVTSTGEAPGVNRLEIVGDQGKLLLEEDRLTFFRTRKSVTEFIQKSPEKFASPEAWKCDIPFAAAKNDHAKILEGFAAKILNDTPLLAPGEDGLSSLELANAMLLSTWTDHWVNFPMNDELYYEKLQERVRMGASKNS